MSMAFSSRDAAAVELNQLRRFDAARGTFAFEEAVGADEVRGERGVIQQIVSFGIFDADDGFVRVCAATEGAGNLSEGFVGANADFPVKCRHAAFPSGIGREVKIFQKFAQLFDGITGGFDFAGIGGDDVGEWAAVVSEESFNGNEAGFEAVTDGLFGWIFFHTTSNFFPRICTNRAVGELGSTNVGQ